LKQELNQEIKEKMTDLTPADIASADAGYWAVLRMIRLQASVFSFKDHEYQEEPMRSRVRRKCIMKATQGGFTEIEILDALHGMIFRFLAQGVLYLHPTTDDVQEFSKSRFNPLIVTNREAIGKYVKTAGRGTDTASLKKIHDAFLYLRGARLSQKISDINESSKLKSIPVDRVVFDEVDHMDEDVIAKALGRMGHSKIKQERYLSNPLIPGEGIDKIFSQSDQRHWFRKCSHCGEWTCAELSFPDCVKIRKDGTGYIGCNKCGKEVPIWVGDGSAEWVASVPANSDYMHGYRWSQLTSVFNDPAEILDAFTNPPEGNLADVYRLRLGLPYIAAEDRLTEAQVYNCCCNDIISHSHDGPSAMGVDVGKIKHITIGVKTNPNQYKITKPVQLSSWDDIHNLARRFNVKSAVVDIRPYEDSARKFQQEAKFKVFLCEYKENSPQGTVYNDRTGIVSVNRTEIFDTTHRMVTTPGMLTIPRYCPEVKEFARQMCGAYKVLETNKKSGTSIYRYKGDNDHYRNALNYFILAASKSRIAKVGSRKNRQRVANNTYSRI
jgi:hypothetical protein